MELVKKACQRQELKLAGDDFSHLKVRLYEMPWILIVRDPVKNPEHVLAYLARFTHRVAIANSRIKALKDGMVTFTVKNRRRNRTELFTITAVEFIRQLMRLSEPSNQLVATAEGIIQQLTGNDMIVCPCCLKGKMPRFRQIPKKNGATVQSACLCGSIVRSVDIEIDS